MPWLTDANSLLKFCREEVLRSGLQAVAELAHTFAATAAGPGGVTATVLLAESHVCVHTWPEQRAVTLDVYVCNLGADHSSKAHAFMAALQLLFEPTDVQNTQLLRGKSP
jgi:S-adenosylmethionine decarboxylase